jgi:hypothetical protein
MKIAFDGLYCDSHPGSDLAFDNFQLHSLTRVLSVGSMAIATEVDGVITAGLLSGKDAETLLADQKRASVATQNMLHFVNELIAREAEDPNTLVEVLTYNDYADDDRCECERCDGPCNGNDAPSNSASDAPRYAKLAIENKDTGRTFYKTVPIEDLAKELGNLGDIFKRINEK